MGNRFFYLLCFAIIFITACDKEKKATLFQRLEASETGIDFANNLNQTDSLIALSFEYLYNGAGVAIGDYNNDQLPDIFFTGNMEVSRLYLNKGNLQFEDITEQSGINTLDKWASGAVSVDINQDGWMDIYVCVGGLSTDSEKRSNLLFINQKDNTFQEAAAAYGLADSGYSINALFFDYDKDDDLDMYLLTTELDPYSWTEFRPRRINGEAPNTDKLYRNNGDDTFTDVSQEAGILMEGYGLGMGLADFNNDSWPDLYIANDFLSNDVIYLNNGDGTFTDKIDDYFAHTSRNSMGTDLQDFNNDGFTDLVVLDMLPKSNARQKSMFGFFNYDKFQLGLEKGYQPQYARNTLQMNTGAGTFSEVAQLAGIDQTDWSWSALFADFDNDGWQDLFITNGYRQDITNMDFATYSRQLTSSPIGTLKAKEAKMFEKLRELPEIKTHNYIYRNPGTFPFEDKTKDWGFDLATYSNGAAYTDLDNDGDLDLVINNIDEKAFIYENTLYNETLKDAANYLRVDLEGAQAIGAKVTIYYDDKKQTRLYSPYRGYLSTVESTLHFGLGKTDKIEKIIIEWQNGEVQKLQNVSANQLLKINIAKANPELRLPILSNKHPLFSEVSKPLNITFQHQEKDFIDFKIQPILPHKHSQGNPCIAVGDINNDGLDDFLLGGSADFSAKIMIQTSYGKFQEKEHKTDSVFHDMGALFFDADLDGDQDLYIVSGGTQFQNKTEKYQDRFYLNDGAGNFTLSKSALPEITSSGSSVSAADYDQDGDLDLLVTGRVVPGGYPQTPQSYLLRNDLQNGILKFSDQSASLAEQGKIGMISQALWTDYDQDGQIDLLLAGEWMPLTFLKNNKGNFHTKIVLHASTGWWNSLLAGDFDKDGDTDYIAANLGLNSRYKASTEKPVCVYGKDFDKNGRIDPVMCYYIEDQNYIAHSRDMLIKQINGMRNRFKTYTEYGNTIFERSFTKAELSDAQILRCDNFETSYIENQGNGKFTLHTMPMETQVAPIFGMAKGDFNSDGNPDIMMVGNSYATEIMIGQYDACRGVICYGDGNGKFQPAPLSETGFYVDKDAKALARLRVDGQDIFLASRNRETMKAFAFATDSITPSIVLELDDSYALIKDEQGKEQRLEFYYGDTYLSQSTRSFRIPVNTKQITIFKTNGESRKINDLITQSIVE